VPVAARLSCPARLRSPWLGERQLPEVQDEAISGGRRVLSLVSCGDSGAGVSLDDVDNAVSLYTSDAQPFVLQIAHCFNLVAKGHDASAQRCVHASVTEFETLRTQAVGNVDEALATAEGGCRVRLSLVRARIGSVARATHASASVTDDDRRRESSPHRALGRNTRQLDDTVATARDAC
jgi:hypothetical protein